MGPETMGDGKVFWAPKQTRMGHVSHLTVSSDKNFLFGGPLLGPLYCQKQQQTQKRNLIKENSYWNQRLWAPTQTRMGHVSNLNYLGALRDICLAVFLEACFVGNHEICNFV